jgi:hypothetical protein
MKFLTEDQEKYFDDFMDSPLVAAQLQRTYDNGHLKDIVYFILFGKFNKMTRVNKEYFCGEWRGCRNCDKYNSYRCDNQIVQELSSSELAAKLKEEYLLADYRFYMRCCMPSSRKTELAKDIVGDYRYNLFLEKMQERAAVAVSNFNKKADVEDRINFKKELHLPSYIDTEYIEENDYWQSFINFKRQEELLCCLS